MARRLNVRFLLWSLAIVTVLTITAFGLHRWQLQRNAHAYLRQGERALDKRLVEQALVHFRRYLAFHPDDLDALTKYSDALDQKAEQTGSSVPLIFTLEKILWRDPDRHETRHRLILALIRNGRYREAQEHLDKLIPHWPRPAELVHIKGWCQNESAVTAEGYKQAAASYARAVEIDPTHVTSYVLWAELLQDRLRQPEEAGEVMDRMVKANANEPASYLLRARYRRIHDQHEASNQDVQAALRLAPDDPDVLLTAADVAQAAGQVSKALEHVQKALSLHPRRPDLIKARANLALRTGDRAGAIAFLREGIKGHNEAWDLRILLIDLLIDDKQLAEATDRLAELKRAGLMPALPNYLQARLRIEQGRWTEALTILERARLELPTGSAWSGRVNALLGNCYEQTGNVEQALKNYREAIDAGETRWAMVLQAVRLCFDRRRFDEAEHVLRKVQERGPLSGELARLGADLARLRAEPIRALQLAALAVSADATDYRDLLWLGRMHAWTGDVKSADKLFRRAIMLAGHVPDVWIAMAEHLRRSGQSATGDWLVQEMKPKVPAALAPYTLARILEELGRVDQAQAAYEQALAAPDADCVVVFAAADFYRRSDKSEQAALLWRKLLNPDLGAPGDLTAKARRHLAVYLSTTGDPANCATALALLDENDKNVGETFATRRSRAVVLGAQPNQRRAACRAFEETLKNQPATPDELLALAQLYDADDIDFSRVYELLTDALPPGQEAAHILAYFVRTLINHGEIADARTRFGLLEKLDPSSVRTRELRASLKKIGRG